MGSEFSRIVVEGAVRATWRILVIVVVAALAFVVVAALALGLVLGWSIFR